MNCGFGKFLKEYLEYNNISQTEFATRLNVTQKHINEILNGKSDITLEMAASIEKITSIPISFIINSENRKYVTNYLYNIYGTEKNLNKELKVKFPFKELEDRKWINFQDITNPIQNYMDIINFLKVRNLEALDKIQEKTLFKKNGDNFNKLSLWISRCDELVQNQKVNEYLVENFYFLIDDLKKEAYNEKFNIDKIQEILNNYGIYFVVEKALSGTKVRGCFRVKGKHPAIYNTKNYSGKDSFYYELFHELGHCKSDYNVAKNKIIVDGTDEQEKRADRFALNTMIDEKMWNKIECNYSEENLLKISKENKIPMSFIVGRLAKVGYIKYNSKLYNKYKLL